MAERCFTLAEIAERFQFSSRWMRDFIRAHGIPVLHTGRQIRFDDLALRSFEEALRRCPSKLFVEKTPAASPSSAPSSYRMDRGSVYERALSLTSSPSPVRKPPRSRSRSSATRGTANALVIVPSDRR